MKNRALKNCLAIGLMLIGNCTLYAQGNIAGVTPPVGNISSTVTLQISGANTVFTQATSILKQSSTNFLFFADAVTLVNDSTMSATYTIPNDLDYLGLWDVYAGAAAPLQGGFLIQPNGVVLKGNFFKDADANCVYDPSELPYYHPLVNLNIQPVNVTVPIQSNGQYIIELPLGTYNAVAQIVYPASPGFSAGMFCDSTFLTIPINAPSPQIIAGPDIGVALRHVTGTIYFDSNNDCNFNAGEPTQPNGYVKYTPGNFTATVQSDGTYDLTFYTASANGVLNYIPTPYSGSIVGCPANGNLALTFNGASQAIIPNKNFGLVADTCPRIKATSFISWSRPCFVNNTNFSIQNHSPKTAYNVVSTINIDPQLTVNSANIPWTNIVGNTLTYAFDSIVGFQNIGIQVSSLVNCNAVVGDTIHSSIEVDYTPAYCIDTALNHSESSRILTLSYDPNNKETSMPFGEIISVNEPLEYVINFQNTGTDTAFTVTLVDTLPTRLIPTSLLPIMSSHNYTYHLTGNVIKFLFQNINLPDSNVNEPGSKGFIVFSIRQTANNPLGTIIKNKAAIYFDFNDPIITNFTYNIIPLVTAQNETMNIGDVTVMPNPFNDATRFVFTNKSKHTAATIQVFDISGKLVDEITNITGNTFEYKNEKLSDQMYFYKAFDQEKQLGIGKLIIKK